VGGTLTASKCTYEFRSGEKFGEKCGEDIYETLPYRICRVNIENGKEIYSEEAYEPPPYCILHLELPIEADPQYDKITSAKDAKVQERIDPQKRDFNFEGAKITSIDLSGRQDISHLNFVNATINGVAWFNGATINGVAWFNGATVEEDASFENATIKTEVRFEHATIKGDVSFDNATLEGELFDCHTAEIMGELSLENTLFASLESQEEAYRKAKQAWDKLRDRKTADDYFYKEMVAKRKRKKPYVSFKEAIRRSRDKSDKVNYDPLAAKNYVREYAEYLLEAPLQYALGYGVYPRRLMFTWIFVAITMEVLLTSVRRNMNDLPFGIATAFVPGYGLSLSSALSGVSLWIVCIETIFGAFFWATFITVFSRKFMR
jgi:hypothetical protein